MPSLEEKFVIETNDFMSLSSRSHLYYRHLKPVTKNKQKIRHIIFHHGLTNHSEQYHDFFLYLESKFGDELIISYFDLLGHGHSGGERGSIDSFKTYYEDTAQFYELCYGELYSEFEIVETIIVAHCLGALIALNALLRDDRECPFIPSKCVFINPLLCLKSSMLNPNIFSSLGLGSLVDHYQFSLNFDYYSMSSDEKKIKLRIKDQLILTKLTPNFEKQLKKSLRKINSLSYFMEIPTMFLLSENDDIIDIEKVDLFLRGMRKEIVKRVVIKDAKHDILNDSCRYEAFKEIINYLK